VIQSPSLFKLNPLRSKQFLHTTRKSWIAGRRVTDLVKLFRKTAEVMDCSRRRIHR